MLDGNIDDWILDPRGHDPLPQTLQKAVTAESALDGYLISSHLIL